MNRSSYRPEVDGLRAVAVLAVILFHAGLPFAKGGFLGVDVFFAISGYLITKIIAAALADGSFSLVDFYVRRARRILPALFAMMATSVPFAYFILPPSQLKAFSQSLVATALFSSNLLFWHQSGYFDEESALKPLLHTWSLAVEEQYYLVAPLILLLAWRLARRSGVLAALILGAALSFGVSEMLVRHDQSANFYFVASRAWELLAGGICGLIRRRDGEGNGFLAAVGMCAVLVAMFLFDEQTISPSPYSAIPVLGTCLVLVYAREGTLVGCLLSFRLVVGIGLISYSLYLWHQPVLVLGRLYFREPNGVQLTALLLVCLILSLISWRYIEVPVRERRVLSTTSSLAAAVGLGNFAIAALGLAGHLGDGLPDRFPVSQLQERYYDTALSSPMRDRCHTEGAGYLPPGEACVYLTGDAATAVVGDSHAVELAYALATELQKEGQGVRHLTFSSCRPPASQIDRESSCGKWSRDVLEYLSGNPQIKNVVLSYRMEGRKGEAKAIADFVRYIARSKRVVLVLPYPELESSIKDKVFFNEIVEGNIPGVSADLWRGTVSSIRQQLGNLGQDVVVVDPATEFCDGERCYGGLNGTSYFFDAQHLSLAGAGRLADRIVPALILD